MRLIICAKCGEEKKHYAKGLCRECYDRRYNEAHPRDRRAYLRRYYREHREEMLASSRHYYQEHREECDARSARWDKENPDNRAARKARRRAREKKVSNTLTAEEARSLLAIGQAMYPGEGLHLDHIVPISKGGGTTRANMRAIPGWLNQSKGDRLPEEVYSQIALGV